MKNAKTGLWCYRAGMGRVKVQQVRACAPGQRVRVESRVRPEEHRKLAWAARIAGESQSLFIQTAIAERVAVTLREHGDVLPIDLRPELDAEPFFY